MGAEKDNLKRKNVLRVLRNVFVGAVIGLGGILPGVSGGMMAVSFGLYRPILDAFVGLLKEPVKNLRFLLPIGVGAGAGFFAGSFLMNRFMHEHYAVIMYLFLGMVVGGIPAFVKEANQEGFKKRYLAVLALGVLAASLFLLAGETPPGEAAEESLTLVQALLAGAVAAVGVAIPGISTSFILMHLGWYQSAMAAVAGMDIKVLICMAIGGLGCVLLTIKTVRWCFDRFRGYAYYAVLGFLIGSAAFFVPKLYREQLSLWIGLLLFAAGFAVAYIFDRFCGSGEQG